MTDLDMGAPARSTNPTHAGTRQAQRGCPLCEAMCGLVVTLDADDQVLGVRADPDDVYSHGYLCPKGASLAHVDGDPDRLSAPMVRVDGELREVTWDEAFAEVDRLLNRLWADHGRDAVAVYTGNPSGHNAAFTLLAGRLARGLGTRQNYSAATMDQLPHNVVAALMWGEPSAVAVPDLDRTDLLVIIGGNPLVSNGSVGGAPDYRGRLRALRARGGRLVVVDPARTATAAVADQHIQILPGTDALLLMALAHVLIRDGLVQLGNAEGRIGGLAVIGDVVAPYAPEAVAARCGVSADAIEGLAHELSRAPSAAVYGRLGTTLTRFGTLTMWAMQLVNLLTGNIDRPGSMMFTTPACGSPTTRAATRPAQPIEFGRHHTRVRGLPEVLGELPVAALAEEILEPGPGRVRGLVTYAGNPARSFPNSAKMQQALGDLDVLVCVDPYLNETTRYADVILPVPGALTRDQFDLVLYPTAVHNFARYSVATRPMPTGMLAEWEILLRLCAIYEGRGPAAETAAIDDEMAAKLTRDIARNLGLPESDVVPSVPERGPRRLIDLRLRSGPYGDHFGQRPGGLTLRVLLDSPHGVDLGPLQSRIDEVIRTPSGVIELAPQPMLDDLPRLHAALHEPVPELSLIGRRDMRSKNSWLHNIAPLAKGRARSALYVHRDDAARRAIGDGDRAVIRSAVGELEVDVQISDEVGVGVCSLPHGWGHDDPVARLQIAQRKPGVNSNTLTDDTVLDPVSGTVQMNAIPVELSPLA